MPFCPTCQTEYKTGSTRCTDCDTELVDSLPSTATSETEREGIQLVELASFPNAPEAEMIQELLEGNDIGTVIRGDVDPIGATSGAEPATLLVERKDLARAREIYDAYFAGDAVSPDSLPADLQ